MIKIKYYCIDEFKKDDFNKIFLTLPKYRQDKIINYKNDNDKLLCLLAGKLLHDEIGELDKQIYFNEYGKGYLPNQYQLYFSLSHSKKYVMLVIADKEVGCDIQYMKNVDLNIAEHFFNKNEYDEIISSDNIKECFYKYWSIKEAYLKCIGVGLNKPLSSINIIDNNLSDSNYCIYLNEIIDKDYYAAIVIKNK